MRLKAALTALFAGAVLSGSAMAAKPGTNTVPMHTVKMVEEGSSSRSLADASHRERTIGTLRVIRSERRGERRERTWRHERRRERRGERRERIWRHERRERRPNHERGERGERI